VVPSIDRNYLLCDLVKMNETSELIHRTIENLNSLAKKTQAFRQQKLENKIKDLKQFCDRIDPYKELNSVEISFLKKYHIYPPYDPFMLTNKLLLELENTIEELEELKNEK